MNDYDKTSRDNQEQTPSPAIPSAIPSAPEGAQQPPAFQQMPVEEQPSAAPQFGTQAAYPHPAPAPGKRKLGTGATLAIIGGAIVVVIVLVIGIVFSVSRVGAGLAAPAESSSPSEVVTAYLTAIADGDAEQALEYLDSAPDNTSLLTDEVLAESNKAAPITEIKVTKATGGAGSSEVTVAYLMNGSDVTTTYSTYSYGNDEDEWKISGGTGSLYATPFDGLGLTVNGQEAEGENLEVFPGTYTLATSLENFELTGPTTVTVTEPYGSVGASSIEPALTEEALQEFRGLIRTSIDACVASTALAAGCGLDLPATIDGGTQLADGTIARTLDADTNATIDSLEGTTSHDNPTLVEAEYIGAPSVEADCTKNGSTSRCSIWSDPSFGRASVDMASDKPEVIWD